MIAECRLKWTDAYRHSHIDMNTFVSSDIRATATDQLRYRIAHSDRFCDIIMLYCEKKFVKLYRRQTIDRISGPTTAHRSRSNCNGATLTPPRYVSSPAVHCKSDGGGCVAVSLRSVLCVCVSAVLFSVRTLVVYLVSASRYTAISELGDGQCADRPRSVRYCSAPP